MSAPHRARTRTVALAACCLAGLACFLGACASAVPDPLEALLSCHDQAVGGDALRARQAIFQRIEIVEPAFTLEGRYRARRTGRMRIDVFAEDGTRVFSEGLDGEHPWQLHQDQAEPERVDEAAAAALRHGLEQPGRFWSLADMPGNGHALELLEPETVDGTAYQVVKLTLSDGFETWYWVDAETCLIDRSRNFRAFHPDLDPERTWIESRFEGFERRGGALGATRVRNVDLASGEILGTTTVLETVIDPEIDEGVFSGSTMP